MTRSEAGRAYFPIAAKQKRQTSIVTAFREEAARLITSGPLPRTMRELATPLLAAAAALTSSNRMAQFEMRKRAGAVGAHRG